MCIYEYVYMFISVYMYTDSSVYTAVAIGQGRMLIPSVYA